MFLVLRGRAKLTLAVEFFLLTRRDKTPPALVSRTEGERYNLFHVVRLALRETKHRKYDGGTKISFFFRAPPPAYNTLARRGGGFLPPPGGVYIPRLRGFFFFPEGGVLRGPPFG